jgi:hypothetical protein
MMMITTAIKSYFLVIVALASVMGSALAAPHISNLVNDVGSSSSTSSPSEPPSSSLIQTASAQKPPFEVDHHLKIKEKVDDPIRIEEEINDAEQHCEMECKYIEYKPGRKGEAGLAFNSDTPLDLSGADKVRFFLMGENGGEKVEVKLAGKKPGKGQKGDDGFKEKFALSTDVITLPNDWQRYEVPLNGVDLKNVVAPFAIELLKGKGSATQVVYLKYIVYEDTPVDERFLLPANTTSNATTTGNTTTANTTGNATAQDTALQANNNNNTQGRQSNETTTTANNNTAEDTSAEQSGNATSNTPVEGQGDENLAPIAMLRVDSLVAHPGDRVILDGSLSNDPDGDEITYQWSQSDGPGADIINADTATPTVTIPQIGNDEKITIDLVVSDGQIESNRASVIIDIQYNEEIEDAIKQDLAPDDDIAGQGWSDAACGSNSGIVDCLTDSSDTTFVSSDTPDKTTELLFSFQDPSSVGINGSNDIAYVTAQVTAKKAGASGFISLIVDDSNKNEHYSTPSISIVSDSFEEDYSFTWKNNPVTGEPWTIDSLNSLVAGYRYLTGQGSGQISEFKLIITSLIAQEEQEPPPTPPSSSAAIDGETSSTQGSETEEGNGDNVSDEEGSAATSAEEEEEEPAPPDSGISTDEGASG